MNRWQSIVFDLDDTLYPERDYVLSGFKAVAHWAEEHASIPFEQGYRELKNLFESGVRGNTFNHWLAIHDLPIGDRLLSQLIRVYREHEPDLEPFPEIPAFLESIHHRCFLGLLSDGYLTVQRRKLTALRLAHHFDAVVFSDQWGRRSCKPSIKPFKAVLELLHSEAARSIYVADNPLKDFFGARQLGMFSVRVRRPNGEYASLSPPTAQHAPDLTIESLTEFAAFLTEALELLSANSDLTNCKPGVQKRLGGFNVENT
jgi:putative hydrolase of the HAD superfamily